MKVLLALANYGMKNAAHAKQVLDEYRSIDFAVDIHVLCEAPKGFGSDVKELVGLPTPDPWSLPFGHRRLFVEHAAQYDVFIYTEDDVLIRQANIEAFLRASQVLDDNVLPGFIRYEIDAARRKRYPDIHGPFHWKPETVGRCGEYVFAELSNNHSACYMLTRKQLQRAIASGGFSLQPHSGRYDMLCAAATDPYTRCGFRPVVCVSHVEDFELHHLSNAYVDRLGIDEDEFRVQLKALYQVLEGTLDKRQLFPTLKNIDTMAWDKNYYEPCREDLLQHVPASAQTVLSVGCGSGQTEAKLAAAGREVTALPLDSVIGRLAQRHGIRVLPPDLATDLEFLGSQRFDVILLSDVLQHVAEPPWLLRRLSKHLNPQALIIGSVPNLGRARRMAARLARRDGRWAMAAGPYAQTRLQLTDRRMVGASLETAGLRPVVMKLARGGGRRVLPAAIMASEIIFAARKADIG
jgi:2-polyprenyl-3-methyl-5-hydroxy-6-metoxy-1,4-benzoquinol methylase